MLAVSEVCVANGAWLWEGPSLVEHELATLLPSGAVYRVGRC